MTDPPRNLRFIDFTLELPETRLRREGEIVRVSSPALRVLSRLVSEPFAVIARDELLQAGWGLQVSEVTLNSAINELRRALMSSPYVGEDSKPTARISAKDIILSHYGDGYEFRTPMPILDFRHEWYRHGTFCTGGSILKRIDYVLSDLAVDRGYIVITGSPGVGKSALLTHWLKSRVPGGAWAPHHFIRKEVLGWAHPKEILRNLLAQIDPAVTPEQDMDTMRQRLIEALDRRAPRRLCIVVDGLDEISGKVGGENPLPMIFPETLPPGAHVICASRSSSNLSWFDTRSPLHRIDLDGPEWDSERRATCRKYWEYRRGSPGTGVFSTLSDTFVDAAVSISMGSMLYTVKLAESVLERQDVVDLSRLPVGLEAFLEDEWTRIEKLPPISSACVIAGLRILASARVSLSLDDLEQVACGVAGVKFSQEIFSRYARPFLLRVPMEDRYRLFHEAFRDLVARKMPAEEAQLWHRQISRTIAKWPAPPGPLGRNHVAVSNALYHRALAGDAEPLLSICLDIEYILAKIENDGVEALEYELELAARCENVRAGSIAREIRQAIGRQAYWIRRDVGATGELLQFALRCAGWSDEQSSFGLNPPRGPQVRLLHPLQHRDDALRVLPLPGNTTWDCCVAPDCTVLVCNAFQSVAIWDLQSGRLRRLLRGHAGMVLGCAISSDSKIVASAGFDRTVRLWDAETGECRHVLQAGSIVGRLAFAPDGLLAVPCWDGTIGVWNSRDGELVRLINAHSRPVLRCVISRDGQRILSSSSDRSLSLRDIRSGGEIARLTGHAGSVLGCDIDRTGRYAISGARDDVLKLWDLEQCSLLDSWEAAQDGVNNCKFSEDSTEAVSAGNDGSIKRWDIHSTEEKGRVPGYSLGAHALAFVPGTTQIVTGGYGGIVKVWDMKSLSVRGPLEGHATSVTHCLLSRDERLAFTGADDRTVHVWDVESGRVVGVLRGHGGPITALALDSDEKRIVSGSEDCSVRVWNLASGRSESTLKVHSSWVTACIFGESSQSLLTGTADGDLWQWDLRDGGFRILGRRMGPSMTCAAGQAGCVVIGFEDGQIEIMSGLGARSRLVLAGHNGGVMRCKPDPDGRFVATVGIDRVVKVWELDSGRCLAKLAGHKDTVTDCAFLADGLRIVTVSADCTMRLWNISSQACEKKWYGGAAFLSVAAGKTRLVAGDFVGNVWILEFS